MPAWKTPQLSPEQSFLGADFIREQWNSSEEPEAIHKEASIIHSSLPRLLLDAAHSAVCAMVPPIFPRGTVSLFVFATIEPPDCGWRARRERRRVEVVGPSRNGHELQP